MVGAGRSRNGLGPFLATHLHAGGADVVAISGRDRARTAQAAEELQARTGCRAAVCGDAAELCAQDLDALVVASPAEAHLEPLQAALAAGLPVLCEKPLYTVEQAEAGAVLVGDFLARGLPLWEHAQWPETLPVWRRLHPTVAATPLRSLEMRLSPSFVGPGMLGDALSHPLSLLQGLLDPGVELSWADLDFRAGREPEEALDLRARLLLGGAADPVDLHLELRVCLEQPRPAWYAVNGARIDRRIDVSAGYAISFHSAGRAESADDPSAALVYRFLSHLREEPRDRDAAEPRRVRQRQRLYVEALRAYRAWLG